MTSEVYRLCIVTRSLDEVFLLSKLNIGYIIDIVREHDAHKPTCDRSREWNVALVLVFEIDEGA